MGHYLTALSFTWLNTGDASILARLNSLVDELSLVQVALGSGYLSAFPSEHFDRLQSLEPVWAPYYVIHKIMAGLLDAHELADNPHAMDMVVKMASYFTARIDETIKVNGTAHWEKMLETEFGGMNDVLYRLHSLTKNSDHLRIAKLFDKPSFFGPLVKGWDHLGGLHANTHLAQVVGFASGFEVTASPDSRAAVETFFSAITSHHSYATGGSNDHEFWGPADSLADAVFTQHDALETQETCTTYNILKIARTLFRWTGNLSYADFYERGLLNGIVGVSRLPPADMIIIGEEGQPHSPVVSMSTMGSLSSGITSTSGRGQSPSTSRMAERAGNDGGFESEEEDPEVFEGGEMVHGWVDHRLVTDYSEAVVHGGAVLGDRGLTERPHGHGSHAGHSMHAHGSGLQGVMQTLGRGNTRNKGGGSLSHGGLESDGILKMSAVGGGPPKSDINNADDIQAPSDLTNHDGHSAPPVGFAKRLIAAAVAERVRAQGAAKALAQSAASITTAHVESTIRMHSHIHSQPSHHSSSLTPLSSSASSSSASPSKDSSSQPFESSWGARSAPSAVVPAYSRSRTVLHSSALGFQGPPPDSNASNAAGPGVYLYLLPMGTGQSKGDNSHHWGFPEHSFWCCYGTAVESFSKLQDSIYFHGEEQVLGTGGEVTGVLPQLYINQLVTSTLSWRDLGVVIEQDATMFAQGPSSASSLQIVAAPPAGIHFVMMVRIPAWAKTAGRMILQVNSLDYRNCPGPPTPGSFCQISRTWYAKDVVRALFPQKWSLSRLQDARPQFGGLQAIMMGPFVMAGITHAGRHLALPPGGIERAVHLTEDVGGLLSLKAAWSDTLYVRHDLNLLQMSEITDGGDSSDATFRAISGCHCALAPSRSPSTQSTFFFTDQRNSQSRGEGVRGEEERGGLPSWAEARGPRCSVRVSDGGQGGVEGVGYGEVITLEPMNYPGYFMTFDPDLTMVLSQPDGSLDFCDIASFTLRPGLSGEPGSRSLEAVAKPGWFLSAYSPHSFGLPPCRNHWSLKQCLEAVRSGRCIDLPEVAQVHCRAACGQCTRQAADRHSSALRLRRLIPDDPDFVAASTFLLANPLTPIYPEGATIVAGRNRAYLLAPLGNLVDERYTVYFESTMSDSSV